MASSIENVRIRCCLLTSNTLYNKSDSHASLRLSRSPTLATFDICGSAIQAVSLQAISCKSSVARGRNVSFAGQLLHLALLHRTHLEVAGFKSEASALLLAHRSLPALLPLAFLISASLHLNCFASAKMNAKTATGQPGLGAILSNKYRQSVAKRVAGQHHTEAFPIFVFIDLLQHHIAALDNNIVAQCMFCVLYLEKHREFHSPEATKGSEDLESTFNRYWQGRMLVINSVTEAQRNETKRKNWPALHQAIAAFAASHYCYDHTSFRLYAFNLVLPESHGLRTKTYGTMVIANMISRILTSKWQRKPISSADLTTVECGHNDLLKEKNLDPEQKHLRQIYHLADAEYTVITTRMSVCLIRDRFIQDKIWKGRSAGQVAHPSASSAAGSSRHA